MFRGDSEFEMGDGKRPLDVRGRGVKGLDIKKSNYAMQLYKMQFLLQFTMNIQYFGYLKVLWQHNICILYRTIWKDFLNGFPTLQTESGEIEEMVRT